MQRLEKKNVFCKFNDSPCIMDECAAFMPDRKKTQYEREASLMQDIPIISDKVKNWCSRYDMSVQPIYKVIEVG